MVMSADWTVRTAPEASSSVDPGGVTIVASARRAGRRASQTTRATRAIPPATIATSAITDIRRSIPRRRGGLRRHREGTGFPLLAAFAGGTSAAAGMIGAMAAPRALDAPLAALGDAEALAKQWLVELIAARPLDEAASIPVERLGADGPALVAAVGAALVSDTDLRHLAPEGDRGGLAAAAGAIAGARRPAEVVAALERLRQVLWAAIERGPPESPPAELAARLAHVCATVAQTALEGSRPAEAADEPPEHEL